MKKIKVCVIIVFVLMILAPVLKFNWQENMVSEIDNRRLTNNPFGKNFVSQEGVDLSASIENYVQDRIGFRDDIIYLYTILNDRLFGEMVHPTYDYGEDGYVFFKLDGNIEYGEYHRTFAEMVKEIQDYCEERNVPFLFVFNPAKTTVLQDKLNEGINYNSDWVEQFFKELDDLGVRYIDNTELLKEKTDQGEVVFNKKYNAGHWNDLGAFYGVNHILETLESDFPSLHINEKDDFNISEVLNTSLMVSEFPINEWEPVFEGKEELEDRTADFADEIELNDQYEHFFYMINQKEKQNGSPKVLVFQGSYMNGMGYKFLENSLGEYIAVHDYQNVLNFDYYYNIFQPECVIFEVAEYTFSDAYFSFEKMKDFQLNPAIETFDGIAAEKAELENGQIKTEEDGQLWTISVSGIFDGCKYAYLTVSGHTYDLIGTEDGSFTAAIDGDNVDSDEASVIVVRENGEIVQYDFEL